jgi:hypothetical protein
MVKGMKVRPIHVWLGLGIVVCLACYGGSANTSYIGPRVRLAYLGSLTGSATLYKIDGIWETEVATVPNSSTASDYYNLAPLEASTGDFKFQVRVNNEPVDVPRVFTLTAGSRNTIAAAKQFQGLGATRSFPVSQIAVPAGQWNFAFAHMATGYQGAVDVYVIRGEETLQTAGRAFASVGQFGGTTYRLGDTPGNSIVICPAGTRQALLTIPYPSPTAITSRRFTLFLRGTGPTQGGFSYLIVQD